MSEKIIVKLKYPIVWGDGNIIDQLEFGRIKAKHLKAMPKEMMTAAAEGDDINITAEEMLPIIAALANLTKEQAEEIDLEDLPEISEKIASFFEQYQGIGQESSGQ